MLLSIFIAKKELDIKLIYMNTHKIDFTQIERLVNENAERKNSLLAKRANKLLWFLLLFFLIIVMFV